MLEVEREERGGGGRERSPAGGQHLVREGRGEGGGSGQGVGGRRLSVVEVQGGERRGREVGRERGRRRRERAWPGHAHTPVHLYQGRPITRLLEQLNADCCLPLPFGPESLTLVHSGKVITWRVAGQPPLRL